MLVTMESEAEVVEDSFGDIRYICLLYNRPISWMMAR